MADVTSGWSVPPFGLGSRSVATRDISRWSCRPALGPSFAPARLPEATPVASFSPLSGLRRMLPALAGRHRALCGIGRPISLAPLRSWTARFARGFRLFLARSGWATGWPPGGPSARLGPRADAAHWRVSAQPCWTTCCRPTSPARRSSGCAAALPARPRPRGSPGADAAGPWPKRQPGLAADRRSSTKDVADIISTAAAAGRSSGRAPQLLLICRGRPLYPPCRRAPAHCPARRSRRFKELAACRHLNHRGGAAAGSPGLSPGARRGQVAAVSPLATGHAAQPAARGAQPF